MLTYSLSAEDDLWHDDAAIIHSHNGKLKPSNGKQAYFECQPKKNTVYDGAHKHL